MTGCGGSAALQRLITFPPSGLHRSGFRPPQEDVGYGVYDMYDLGEFDQKGTIRTKYGTKKEYLEAIRAFHAAGIRVFGDIVLNHRMGGDELEEIQAVTVNPENRCEQTGDEQTIRTWSRFTFPGRSGKYSRFIWDHRHFSGTDWDEISQEPGKIYRFADKTWAPETDPENGNFDYLMGADVDVQNPEVKQELIRWGLWFLKKSGADAFRLDAVNLREPSMIFPLAQLRIFQRFWRCHVCDF